jgi:MFS family permease
MKKELWPVLLLALVNTLNFAILIPVLPFMVTQYGGSPITYGALISAYPLFQFFATPLLGRMSDHFGRRPILLLSQAGTALSWVVFSLSFFVPNINIGIVSLPILVLFFARIADGATGGNNSVANAYLSDVTTQQERTKVYGMYGAMVGIGLIIGPIIGALTMTPSFGFLGPALIALLISIITLVYMQVALPESLAPNNRSKSFEFHLIEEFMFIKRLKKYTKNRKIKFLFFLRTVYLYAFTSFTSIFTLYLIDQFDFVPKQVGMFFVLVGIFLIFNQVVVANVLTKKIGDLKTLLLGQCAMVVSQILYVFATNLWIFTPILFLNNMGFSISMPTFKSLLSKSVSDREQGEIMGIDESIVAATSALAPLIATSIYARVGSYTFGIHGIIILIGLFIFWMKKGWR